MHPYSVILVPFPIDAMALFGYFILDRLGLVDERTHYRYHWRPHSEFLSGGLSHPNIFWLCGSDLCQRLEGLLSQLPPIERVARLGILRFCEQSNIRNKLGWNDFLSYYSHVWQDPKVSLRWARSCFGWCLDHGQNSPGGFCYPPGEILPNVNRPLYFGKLPGDCAFETVPTFRSDKPTEMEVVHFERQVFREGNILHLVGQHIVMCVVGPPNSGKSTVAATLEVVGDCLIKSLASRTAWESLQLSIRALNADLGTPTVEAISEGRGKNGDALRAAKKPWSLELGQEAVSGVIKEKTKANIIIVDIPGRIDEISELILSAADCGIILTHDWALKASWSKLLGKMGVELLAQARTWRKPVELGSTVRVFDRGEILTGRITGLQRTVWSWDPFIKFLASALLYDFFPNIMKERERKIHRLCNPGHAKCA
ncbi:MAG: hypothetical protein Q8N81_06930 [bacterium]|nr:hypothetical protein [bacterium]